MTKNEYDMTKTFFIFTQAPDNGAYGLCSLAVGAGGILVRECRGYGISIVKPLTDEVL